MQCGKCYDICPTEPKSINYEQKEETIEVESDTVILATGYDITPVDKKKEYNNGNYKNVITAFQAERLLAPNGPYGSVIRPSDGKIPNNIAFVLCAGSRDKSIGMPYCSRVCCMYSIKQAMLLSGALPLADITIYYMDIRAFGKGYEQFYRNAEAMGIKFKKAKVAKIFEKDDGDLELKIENLEETGAPMTVKHDLVILASGIIPGAKPSEFAPVTVDEYGFIKQPKLKWNPVESEENGLYICGTCTSPKDIVDTIVEAGAAAMQASSYISRKKIEVK
jgi:heterodisulfide reductase subunit A